MEEEKITWDDYFMTMVYLIASKSKDKRTKIGAVVIGPKNEIRSSGYNSFVRGLNDLVAERQERPEKYYWFEHAERNAIYNATLMGVSVNGCKMYTNGTPCMDCSRGIVQSGIGEVIIDKNWESQFNFGNSERWKENSKRTLEMFAETGIKLRYHQTKYVEIKMVNDGKIIPIK